ncbi:hypothetical protein ES707_22950 [subsurface metagenome]
MIDQKHLVGELNKMFAQHLKELSSKKFRIKVCNNQVCIENSKDITGYLKGKRKDIPICGFRNFCPDAHFHYFDYKPEYVKRGGK